MPPQDANTELAELAGGLIHEIKNHLSTFGLHLQLLAEDFASPQTPRDRKALERINKMQHECERLTQVANDFLRFAKPRDLHRDPTAISDLLEEMTDFFGPTARAGGIEIRTYLPPDLPSVSVDRELFRQALLNLMLNAEQAMPEGGELTIVVRREGEQIRIDLIDTGTGMSPDVLANCFRPFFTNKPGGNGLGLPTSRRIVELHGGRMDVQSEPDKGTQFTILLPISPPANE